jgi:hypothetical protein
MLPFRFAFEQCRRELSLPARSTLDQLAARLAMLKPEGGDILASWTRVIRRSAPSLTTEECQAFAAYALRAQETQMSFNLQYLQFQNSMQNDNRQFDMVSGDSGGT